MKKMKLEDRISIRYILLFLLLIFISNVGLLLTLNRQNEKQREKMSITKSNEINDFLNKIMFFSDKYQSLTLQFSPRLDGQKVMYSKPFNPGVENFLYILKVVNSRGEVSVPLNTLSALDLEISNENSEELIKEIEKHDIRPNDPKKGKVIVLDSEITGNDGKYYYVFKIDRNIKENKFTSYILRDVTHEVKLFTRLRNIMISATLLGIIIIAIVSKFLSRRILRPVNNVIRIAETITTDDLSKRIPVVKTGDELEKLTRIINQMLNRIENSFENQSKFVSDASHELRTPLTIIRGYAEIIKKRKLANPEIFEESIDSIINECDNMKNLVQKLLFLAKGEITKINTNFKPLEIENVVEQIYNDTIVSMKSHEFILEKNDVYEVEGDSTLLQQAIRALIENATKYSNEGTKIYIKSVLKGKFGEISIRDEGIGIDEENIKRVFDRFYRVDESRTKSTGGTGLGLAIVKRIVEIHKGKVKIHSKINEGTEITIQLPVVEIEK